MQQFLFEIENDDTICSLQENDTEKKLCSKCAKKLPLTEFSPCSGGKYLRPECRECGYDLAKTRKLLKQEYGNPPDDYICPICLKNENDVKGFGGKNVGSWVIDHHHKTKQFRGWLCHKCNRIFNDDCTKDLLLRAIQYLEE